MTAIVGYTARQGINSIGVLCADNLEGSSKTKVDKLTKISNQFVIGVTGLECVDWAIGYTIGYFEQFSGSRIKCFSISELEIILNEALPYAFKTLKDQKFCGDIENQIDLTTLIVILDLSDNKLYYSDLGKVWRIDEKVDYRINFNPLEDGLYSFGAVAVSKDYNQEDYNELDREKVVKAIETKYIFYQAKYPNDVGQLGSIQINMKGQDEYELFKSCFKPYKEFMDNMIIRSKKEK